MCDCSEKNPRRRKILSDESKFPRREEPVTKFPRREEPTIRSKAFPGSWATKRGARENNFKTIHPSNKRSFSTILTDRATTVTAVRTFYIEQCGHYSPSVDDVPLSSSQNFFVDVPPSTQTSIISPSRRIKDNTTSLQSQKNTTFNEDHSFNKK